MWVNKWIHSFFCLYLVTSSPFSFALNDEFEITFEFTAPTSRIDGSVLPNTEIKFYNIYYGSSEVYGTMDFAKAFDNPGSTKVVYKTKIQSVNLPEWERVCSVITSVADSNGGEVESGPSNPTCRTVPTFEPLEAAEPIDNLTYELIPGTGGESGSNPEVILSWTAPDSRIDGGLLAMEDIKHYKIYWTPEANDPVSQQMVRTLKNPSVMDLVYRTKLNNIPDWPRICVTVKTTALVSGLDTAQSEAGNWVCQILDETDPPPPPPPAPGTIIDLEADVVNINTENLIINTSSVIINTPDSL